MSEEVKDKHEKDPPSNDVITNLSNMMLGNSSLFSSKGNNGSILEAKLEDGTSSTTIKSNVNTHPYSLDQKSADANISRQNNNPQIQSEPIRSSMYKSPHNGEGYPRGHMHSKRFDHGSWRNNSGEEHPDYKPPEKVLKELAHESIFPLKKKSLRFVKAKYLCRLCEYHCDSVVICRKHIRDARHIAHKEMKAYENCLRLLPHPSSEQIDAITELLEKVVNEQLLPEDEYDARTKAVAELERKLVAVVPDVSLAISGSTLSKFALKTSNVDIDIIVPPDVKPATALLAVKNIVQNDEAYIDVINDLSSRFPCMLFVHKATRTSMVVGTNSPRARSTNKLFNSYNSLDPRAKRLIICLKYWAKLCQIDNQRAGTLPSHAFPIMGIHFLQQISPPILPCLHDLHPSDKQEEYLEPDQIDPPWKSSNTDSLGKLWVMLFHYYCIDLKSQFVTNIRSKQPFLRKEKTWNRRLAIEDPFHQKRNLVITLSGSHVMDYILDCFKTTYRYFVIPQMNFGYLFKFVDAENHGNLQQNVLSEKEIDPISDQDGILSEEELEEEEDDDGEDDVHLSNDTQAAEMTKKIFVKENVQIHPSLEKRLTFESENKNLNCNCEDSRSNILIKNIKSPLETPSICLAKKLIGQVEKKYLCYDFNENSFTGGAKVPLFCSSCQKNGHTKLSCTEYNLPALVPFPDIKPSFYNMLTTMLTNLKEECEPTISELMERDRLVGQLESFIRQSYPAASLRLFGSSTNGFGFANSDLDICLSFKDNTTGEGLEFIQIIETLAEKFKRFRLCGHVLPITTAKVPIIKFSLKSHIFDPLDNIRKPFMLEADLSLYNTLALQNTRLLNTYAKIDPRVQILGYSMKYFAKLCNIGDASRGSLSSYAYIIIVLHYLQHCNPPVIPVLQELYFDKEQPKIMIDGWNTWFFDNLNKLHKYWKGVGQNKKSTGELWIGMLRYYTEEFDWNNNVVTIRQLAPLTRLEKLWTTRCISIEDPFDLSHNLGAGLTRKMNTFIMKAFIRGREVFGYGKEVDHHPFQELVTYFFDPKKLTDGAPPNDRGCRCCGKIGHIVKDCPKKKAISDRKEIRKKNIPKEEEVVKSPTRGKPREKFGKGAEARDQLLENLPKDYHQMKLSNGALGHNRQKQNEKLYAPESTKSQDCSTTSVNKVVVPNSQSHFKGVPLVQHNSLLVGPTPTTAKIIDPNMLFNIAAQMGGGTVALSDPSRLHIQKRDTLGVIPSSRDPTIPFNQQGKNCDNMKLPPPPPPPGFSPHREELYNIQAHKGSPINSVALPSHQNCGPTSPLSNSLPPAHPHPHVSRTPTTLPMAMPQFGDFLSNSLPSSMPQFGNSLPNSLQSNMSQFGDVKFVSSPGNNIPRQIPLPLPHESNNITSTLNSHNAFNDQQYQYLFQQQPLQKEVCATQPNNLQPPVSRPIPQKFTDTNAFMSLFLSQNSGVPLPLVPQTHCNVQSIPKPAQPSNSIPNTHTIGANYSQLVHPPPGVNPSSLNSPNQIRFTEQTPPIAIPSSPLHHQQQIAPASNLSPAKPLDFGFGPIGAPLAASSDLHMQMHAVQALHQQQTNSPQNSALQNLQNVLFHSNQ